MVDKLAVDLEIQNLTKSLGNVKLFNDALVNTDKNIQRLSAGTSFAGSFDRQLANATARHKKFVDDIKRQSAAGGKGSDFTSSLAGSVGLGGSLGSLAGGAIGTGIVVGATAALSAAKAADDANRVLRAGAVETGIAYDKLAAQADAFGKRASLSNTEAQRTFAQLANFANAAGRTDKLDEFQRKFTDLAAAKGINASQLGDISRQLNALTDEATDKLLNANPSAFYDKFAKSLNKTAEQLTDAEKRAAVFDEVLKKGALFSGEAERRAAGFSGEIDNLKKNFDDLTASAGKALVPVAQFIIGGGQIDRKLFRSDAEKAEIARNTAIVADARAKEVAETLRASDKKIRDSQANPFGSLQNFALSKVNLATGFSDPIARDKAIAEATAGAQKYIDDLKTRITKSLAQGGDQTFTRAEFLKNINLFDQETRDKFINDFSANYAEGLRKILQKVRVTVPELRKGLADALKTSNLNTKDRDAIGREFTDAILAQINAGRARVNELGKSTDALFANLFAKRGASNPFVEVFSEADKAIESTRLATAGLRADLRATADQLVNTINANALFSARLETRLQAVDLRGDAANFRNTRQSDTAAADKFANDAMSRFRRDLATGLFKNPENLAAFRSGTSNAVGLDLFNFQRQLEQSGGLFRNPEFDEQTRRRLSAADPTNTTVQDRLDKQLAVIRDLNPSNDIQRAEADRKIIALTQGLDPNTLTDRERNAAAAARENEATRLENAETAAKTERADAAKVQTSIDANIAELLKIAKSDGLTGVIRIINEAEDKANVELGKRPTPRDVKSITDL